MILPKFKFTTPISVVGVCSAMKQGDGKAKVIAGGTDILVNMKKKLIKPDVLICLDKILKLKGISSSSGGGLNIGPLVTMVELVQSKVVFDKYPALSKAAAKLGTPQIRNLATIGGNICSARPAADTLGPLIGYRAEVTLVGSEGERRVDLEEFFTGPGETVLDHAEILTNIFLPPPIPDTYSVYIKIGARKTAEIAIVSVTSVITLDPDSGRCKSARIVLGAVAPTFVRSQDSEHILMGEKISEKLAAQAGVLAAKGCSPISDMRGTAEYRRMLVEVLTKRAILEAVQTQGA